MCAVCGGASGVLTCTAHLLVVDVVLSRAAASVAGALLPQGRDSLCPVHSHTVDVAHAGSRADCSLQVCTLVS